MKKSKLIVPAALAVMLLSTAASVTGTVAWFTANRAVEIGAGKFEVTSTDGSLAVTLADGNCTTADNTTNAQKITVNSGCKLTDASVNLATPASPVVYSDDPTEDGSQPTAFHTVASNYAVAGATDVYYCATWTMTFTYTFAADLNPINLFFDCSSTMAQDSSDTGALETGKGFRIGMATSTKAIVFAKQESLGKCNYVASTSALADATNANGSYTAYTEVSASGGNLVSNAQATSPLAKATDETTSQTSRGDYLGQFTAASAGATSSITVNCFAWFEGTDENVVNNKVMNTMTANLKFYTRRNKA